MLPHQPDASSDDDLAGVYERIRPRLRAMAARLVGWDAAEDVVQEVFVRVLTRAHEFRREASMATWLTRILVNAAIDETRRRKRRGAGVPCPDVTCLDRGAMPLRIARIELRTALRTASRSDREVLVLVGLLGWTHDEAAARLGLTEGRTKSRLWNARRRLRRALTAPAAHRG